MVVVLLLAIIMIGCGTSENLTEIELFEHEATFAIQTTPAVTSLVNMIGPQYSFPMLESARLADQNKEHDLWPRMNIRWPKSFVSEVAQRIQNCESISYFDLFFDHGSYRLEMVGKKVFLTYQPSGTLFGFYCPPIKVVLRK